jgi:hypothetical protein
MQASFNKNENFSVAGMGYSQIKQIPSSPCLENGPDVEFPGAESDLHG